MECTETFNTERTSIALFTRKSTIVAVIEGHMTTADSQIIQKEQNVLSKPGAQQRV